MPHINRTTYPILVCHNPTGSGEWGAVFKYKKIMYHVTRKIWKKLLSPPHNQFRVVWMPLYPPTSSNQYNVLQIMGALMLITAFSVELEGGSVGGSSLVSGILNIIFSAILLTGIQKVRLDHEWLFFLNYVFDNDKIIKLNAIKTIRKLF